MLYGRIHCLERFITLVYRGNSGYASAIFIKAPTLLLNGRELFHFLLRLNKGFVRGASCQLYTTKCIIMISSTYGSHLGLECP